MVDIQALTILLMLGLIAGFAAGLFGTGGGTLFIPMFLSVFPLFGISHNLSMHFAVATSLALIMPTTLVSSIVHYRAGSLPVSMVKKWIPGIIIGACCGALAIHYISGQILKLFFAFYLLICFIFTSMKKPSNALNSQGPSAIICGILSFTIGTLSTLLGVGGGTFTVPSLLYFDYPVEKAISISSLTGFFIGMLGATIIIVGSYHLPNLPKYTLGYVNLLAFAAVMPTTLIASPLGAKLSETISKPRLRRLYSGYLLFALLLMLYHLGLL